MQTDDNREWLDPRTALSRFSFDPGLLERPVTEEREIPRYGYRIGSFNLLVARGVNSEVMQLPAVSRIPSMPAHLRGIANIRGHLVPVMDLHHLLQTGRDSSREQRCLMIDSGAHVLAVLIDGYPVTVRLAEGMRSLTLPGVIGEHAAVRASAEGGLWIDLDHRALFRSLSAA